MRRFRSGSYRSQSFVDVDEKYPQEIDASAFSQLVEVSKDPLELAVSCRKLSESDNYADLMASADLVRALMDYKRHWQILLEITTALKNLAEQGETKWILNEMTHEQLTGLMVPDSYQNSDALADLMSALASNFSRMNPELIMSLMQFFDECENEGACFTILRLFQGLFNKNLLNMKFLQRWIQSLCKCLINRSDTDLIYNTLVFIEYLYYDTKSAHKYIPISIDARAGQGLISHFGSNNEEIKVLAMKNLQHITSYNNFMDERAVVTLLNMLRDNDVAFKQKLSDILLGWSKSRGSGQTLAGNHAASSMLIDYITQDNIIKPQVLEITLNIIERHSLEEVSEFVEGNLINVVCRIIERDPPNVQIALKILWHILLSGETGDEFNLFKVLAEECRVGRLLDKTSSNASDVEVAYWIQQIYIKFFPDIWTKISKTQARINLVQPIPTGPAPSLFGNATPSSSRAPKKASIPSTSGKAKGPRGKSSTTRTRPHTPNTKAGLQIPISRIARKLRMILWKQRQTKHAEIYLTAVMEYLISEVLEVAGEVAKKSKHKRITPKDINEAIRNDQELAKLMDGTTYVEGGFIPKPY